MNMLSSLTAIQKTTAILSLLLIIVLMTSGFLAPVLLHNKEYYRTNSKADELKTELEIRSVFNSVEREHEAFSESLIEKIGVDKDVNFSDGLWIEKSRFEFGIFDSLGNLLFWTDNFDRIENERYLSIKSGDYFFDTHEPVVKSVYVARHQRNTSSFTCIVTKDIKPEEFSGNKEVTSDLLTKAILDATGRDVYIKYSPRTKMIGDLQRRGIVINNSLGREIAAVYMIPVAESKLLADISEFVRQIQGMLIFSIILLLFIFIYSRYIRNSSSPVRFFYLAICIAGLRIIFFKLELLQIFLSSGLNAPQYFSSVFLFGMVKSPVEFFITVITAFSIVLIYIKHYGINKFSNTVTNKSAKYFLFLFPAFIFFLLYRAHGASAKSVIFDSTLKYFEEPLFFPQFPVLLMLFNFFILGIILIIVNFFLLKWLFERVFKEKSRFNFTLTFIIFQISGLLFDFFQKQPQGTPFTRVVYITILFTLTYLFYFRKVRIRMLWFYLLIGASISSTLLLIYYNQELERESIKTAAMDYIRKERNYITFLSEETAERAATDSFLLNILTSGEPGEYHAGARAIWKKSPLASEGLRGRIDIYGKGSQYLGGYGTEKYEIVKINDADSLYSESGKILTVKEIIVSGKPVGWAQCTAIKTRHSETKSFGSHFDKSRASGNLNILGRSINVLEMAESHKKWNSGTVFSKEDVEQIQAVNYSLNGEKWLRINSGNEDYLVYAIKTSGIDGETVVVSFLQRKNIELLLYDFFKIFFFNSIITLIILFFNIPFSLKAISVNNLDFRSKILAGFLLISLIPLILSAIYFRSITNERNGEALRYKLKKRAVNITENLNYVPEYGNSGLSQPVIANIEYSLFRGETLIYSTVPELYKAGIFNQIIPFKVYSELVIEGKPETMYTNKADGRSFSSYYCRVYIGNEMLVLEVNNTLNEVTLPFSGTEVDVFLFGSYSLAAILIILVSSMLAGQISKPIIRMTAAINSVASGDLDVKVEAGGAKEISELSRGFNSMVQDLKRNQAELAEFERESAWKEMAKQVAHEIKNPLTPMKLGVQQLIVSYRDKSDKFDTIFGRVTGMLLQQIEQLKNIASEFSGFAVMPRMKLERVDISMVLQEINDLFASEIKLEIKSLPETFLFTDREHLKRALINLIRNSIQADAAIITLNVRKEGELLYLSILDNGKGMNKETVAKVFDRGFSTKQKGMGLGLSIVSEFLESLGGRIEIVRSDETGTEIRLTHPYGKKQNYE